MKNRKLAFAILSLIFCVCSLCFALNIPLKALASEKVISVTGDTYDEEGLLTYRKVSYSQNTFTSTIEDAEYVFLDYKYEGAITDYTSLSIKYKNNGVESLPMYLEYGPGINAGGVDYGAGAEYICVDALDSSTWNVTFSKSIDGYDVLTIRFGNYALTVHDIALRGFRLYFDFDKKVTQTRSFEIYGYAIHESGVNPTFASDPKGCRLSKITSPDAEFLNNLCVVNGRATLNASILDYSTDYKKINISFTVNQALDFTLLLDEEVASQGEYGVGTHVVTVELNKANYSALQMILEGENCEFRLNALTLVATPYADAFSGSEYKVTKQGSVTTVKYTFKMGWNVLSAPIRKYVADYDCLLIEFNIDKPIVMGIMIDDTYLYSHWEHTEPLSVGDHSFFFSLTNVSVTADSSLVIYLDPAITGYAGIEGEKTVVFTNVEFKDSAEMPKAQISVNSLFEFNYDGKEKQASGATTNSGETLVYEYKPVSAKDNAYDTALPVDAGEYDVRITSPLNMTYATTYAYSKLVINKINPPVPTASSLQIDFNSSILYYDSAVFAVSNSQDFSYIIPSGTCVLYGDELFVKYIESTNYYESQSVSFLLNKKEGDLEVTVNYQRETTSQVIDENCEYSKDGLNWTTGEGKRVKIDPGYIYLFRRKATSTSFAGKITYIAIAERPTAPSAPEMQSTTSTSITLKEVEGAEYRLSDTVWQDSPVFEGLYDGMEVVVYIRIKGGNGSFASNESSATFTVGTQPSTSVNSSSVVENGGCGSVLGGFASFVCMPILFGTAVLVIKRRREER